MDGRAPGLNKMDVVDRDPWARLGWRQRTRIWSEESPLTSSDGGGRGARFVGVATDVHIVEQQHVTPVAKVERTDEQNTATLIDGCLNGGDVHVGVVFTDDDSLACSAAAWDGPRIGTRRRWPHEEDKHE